MKAFLYMLPKVAPAFFASLPSIFVPQICSASDPLASEYRKAAGDGECTFEENVNPRYLTTFNTGTVMFAFAVRGIQA